MLCSKKKSYIFPLSVLIGDSYRTLGPSCQAGTLVCILQGYARNFYAVRIPDFMLSTDGACYDVVGFVTVGAVMMMFVVN